MDFNDMGHVDDFFVAFFIGLFILAPFGIWKVVELIIWLCHHFTIVIK